MPPFTKPFCFFKDQKGKLEIIPKFEETQKLNLKHGFWYYEQKQTIFKSKQEKTYGKNTRKWNNINNRGLQEKQSTTPVVAMIER